MLNQDVTGDYRGVNLRFANFPVFISQCTRASCARTESRKRYSAIRFPSGSYSIFDLGPAPNSAAVFW